ncbi:hypothetical protein HPB50_007065 [Hyalomma asiaticum]|uniref:Uncharacterized protein n=1 Tax=Hyalomma asiaticum TaxID=266040 RepID=A0ACB7SPB2_HYAAI|nr:hypothetical protein HPB50_007065 [Hyalomma asiaticum]
MASTGIEQARSAPANAFLIYLSSPVAGHSGPRGTFEAGVVDPCANHYCPVEEMGRRHGHGMRRDSLPAPHPSRNCWRGGQPEPPDGTIGAPTRFVALALSQVLENTAFFGEIVLRLPNIAHTVLNMNKAGAVVLNWAIGFSNSTELYDETTTKLVNLVAQELGLVERDPSYHNPYAVKQARAAPPVPSAEPVPKPKKKKIQRGPRLSRPEL